MAIEDMEKEVGGKYVTRGKLEKVCVKCFKPFETKWMGKSSYFFADAMNICPVCFKRQMSGEVF